MRFYNIMIRLRCFLYLAEACSPFIIAFTGSCDLKAIFNSDICSVSVLTDQGGIDNICLRMSGIRICQEKHRCEISFNDCLNKFFIKIAVYFDPFNVSP